MRLSLAYNANHHRSFVPLLAILAGKLFKVESTKIYFVELLAIIHRETPAAVLRKAPIGAGTEGRLSLRLDVLGFLSSAPLSTTSILIIAFKSESRDSKVLCAF